MKFCRLSEDWEKPRFFHITWSLPVRSASSRRKEQRPTVSSRTQPGRPAVRPMVANPWRLLSLLALSMLAPMATDFGQFQRIGIAQASAPQDSLTPAREDARLRAICFTDPDRGWAVGDLGIIWRTTDGGRSWHFQDSGVTCQLRDVHFLDGRYGWIVGGYTHPYTHQSTGVVLRTQDSGETWVPVPGVILPRLHRVRFFSPREGIALGASSALFPSGVFRTIDAGRSWNLVPGGESRHANTGDLVDMQSGAVAGPRGEMLVLAYGRSMPSRAPDVGERDLHDLRLRSHEGWLVGDGGLIMQSDDGGASWRFPEGRLPEGVQSNFNFHAVSILDDHVWAIGAPGSMVLHSPDRGRRWEMLPTDQPLPLDGLTFFDQHRGWAVGALGTILATRDGGRTWRRQRGGADRAALLGIFSEPEKTPWELFAWYSANEGYIGVLEHLNRRESSNPSPLVAPINQRTEEAIVAVGGSATNMAWNFPIPASDLATSREKAFEMWNYANEGNGKQRMLEYLVRCIRQWRPDVIITEDAGRGPSVSVGLGHEINQLVLTALQQAADPTAHTEQLTLAGLQPWQTKKLYSRMESPGLSAQRLNSSQLATNLATSLDDFTATGRGLIFSKYLPAPSETDFRLLVNTLPNNVSQADLFAGLAISSGSRVRRRPAEQPAVDLDALSRLTQKRRNIEQLIAHDSADTTRGTAWLGQIDGLTRGFSPSMAGSMLYQLAIRYQRQGQAELAADALQRLIETHPNHPLADSALVWLIHYYSSSEVGWRLRNHNFVHHQVVGGDVNPREQFVVQAGFESELVGQPAAAVYPGPEPTMNGEVEWGPETRSRRALELASLIAKTRPALYAEPTIRFPISSVQRLTGNNREAEHYYHQVAGVGLSPSWRSVAQGELWLRHATGSPPRPSIVCKRATERPRLDGKLDDKIWQDRPPIELQSDASARSFGSAKAMFAYDEEFLFFAARCNSDESGTDTQNGTPRPRDADLTQRDRIELLLDLDRDYATYYRLVMDHRGWTFEDCWGDTTWNPRWFVANLNDGNNWTIEMAIPWEEITSEAPVSRSSWAVGVQRIAPQSGFQSWTQPAAVEPIPEGFGILLFE